MMGRLIKNIRDLFRPAIYFIPFTWYFFLFAIALALANIWLSSVQYTPGSSFTDIFLLLVKTGGWFIICLLTLGLLTVLVSYLVFLGSKNRERISFSLSNSTSTAHNRQGTPSQKIHVAVHPVLKPVLGFIKLRLQYDESQYSEKFALAESRPDRLISSTYEGEYTWNLPEIKEYHVDRLILYFEDLFQFFSFTVSLPVRDRFHTRPFAPPIENFTVSPRKTEETTTRIEELKKVEGEYLHYKSFENNDDVRRIVWKIYAKNKDLVVRIPEVLDPYASHAYMYVSFYNHFDITGNAAPEIFFLNYYKSVVWAVYLKLQKEGFDVKYVADQPTPSRYFAEEKQAVQYTVTTSSWQKDKELTAFVNPKDASVIVVSSLCDAAAAEALFNNRAGGTVFVLVRLTRSLQQTYLGSFLYWLFVRQEKNDIEKFRTNWKLSLLRPRIIQNEKKLEAIFSRHDRVLVI